MSAEFMQRRLRGAVLSLLCSFAVLIAFLSSTERLLASTVQQDNSPILELVSQVGGAISSLDVEGELAYVGLGARLAVVDISEPIRPQLVGQSEMLPEYVDEIAFDDGYAYVFAGSTGLHVIDVSDPTAPSLVVNLGTPNFARDVVVATGFVYMTYWAGGGQQGLQIVDVRNPENPILAGNFETAQSANGLAVASGYVYVAQEGGLQVVDVSDPTGPHLIGSVETQFSVGGGSDVALTAGYAYVAAARGGLQIVDVHDPTAPRLVGSFQAPGAVSSVRIAAEHVYITWDIGIISAGLKVLNISDPSAPFEIGSLDLPDSPLNLDLIGNYVYLADFFGLRMVDVSNPARPLLIGNMDTPLATGDVVAVVESYAYVASSNVLQVVDVNDPAMPRPVGNLRLEPLSSIWHTAIDEGYAYLAVTDDGLLVVDVRDPTTPHVVGSLDSPGSAYAVSVAGDYAYVTFIAPVNNGASPPQAGLQVVDISDPVAPFPVGRLDLGAPGSGTPASIVEGYAFVTHDDLEVIDISISAGPRLVGSLNTPGSALSVVVAAGYAYVSDSSAGLLVIDVHDPASPRFVASLSMPDVIRDVAVDGDYVYVTDLGGLRVINVSDPIDLYIVSDFDVPGAANSIAVDDGYAYVANRAGLFVLRFGIDFGFHPSQNGYNFANRVLDRSWEMFEQYFGRENVTHSDGSRCAAAQRFYDEQYRTAGRGYSCVGFAATSLLSYLDWPQPNAGDFAIDHYDALFDQSLSPELTNPIAYYSGAQTGHQWGQAYWDGLATCDIDSGYMISTIAAGIENGAPPVVVLNSGLANFWHVVTPYRVEELAADQVDIYIYDNEAPGQERVIHFEQTDAVWQWTYVFVGTLAGAGTHTAGCTELFLYSLAVASEPGIPPVSFCTTSSDAMTPGQLLVNVHTGAGLTAANEQGRLLRWQMGVLESGIPAAKEIPQGHGQALSTHEMLSLPVGAYDLALNPAPNGSVVMTLFSDGRFLHLSGQAREPAHPVGFAVNATLSEITLKGLEQLSSLSLIFDVENDENSRLATLSSEDPTVGELKASFAGQGLNVSSGAGEAFLYRVRFDSSLGGSLSSEEIELGGGAAQVVKPSNWEDLVAANLELEESSPAGEGTEDGNAVVIDSPTQAPALSLPLETPNPETAEQVNDEAAPDSGTSDPAERRETIWDTGDTPIIVGGLGCIVVLIVGTLLLWRRQRRRTEPEAAENRFCIHCGAEYPPFGRFCIKCGRERE